VTPAPITLRWRGRDVRIRRDDPRSNGCSAVIQLLRSAMTITSQVETLQLVVASETTY
jgi:hypothetical protein